MPPQALCWCTLVTVPGPAWAVPAQDEGTPHIIPIPGRVGGRVASTSRLTSVRRLPPQNLHASQWIPPLLICLLVCVEGANHDSEADPQPPRRVTRPLLRRADDSTTNSKTRPPHLYDASHRPPASPAAAQELGEGPGPWALEGWNTPERNQSSGTLTLVPAPVGNTVRFAAAPRDSPGAPQDDANTERVASRPTCRVTRHSLHAGGNET